MRPASDIGWSRVVLDVGDIIGLQQISSGHIDNGLDLELALREGQHLLEHVGTWHGSPVEAHPRFRIVRMCDTGELRVRITAVHNCFADRKARPWRYEFEVLEGSI